MDDVFRVVLQDPGRPRVTWYGDGFERVELSGKTLDNWVSKTANLLTDELDAGPGSTVGIALPGHWRTVVWLLATWAVGAHAIVDPAEDVDVLVTMTPFEGPVAGTVVAVALPALATSFGGPLPPGAVDAATETRLQGDVFLGGEESAPGDPAFGVAAVTYAELLPAARAACGVPPGTRLLTDGAPANALATVLGPLALDGSLVLHHALATLDEAALAHLRDQEGVTAG